MSRVQITARIPSDLFDKMEEARRRIVVHRVTTRPSPLSMNEFLLDSIRRNVSRIEGLGLAEKKEE